MGRLAVVALASVLASCGGEAAFGGFDASAHQAGDAGEDRGDAGRIRPDAAGPQEIVFLNSSRTTETEKVGASGAYWTYDISLTFENLGNVATDAKLLFSCIPKTGTRVEKTVDQQLATSISTVYMTTQVYEVRCSTVHLRVSPKTIGDWATVESDLPIK
jgi:hypothetical protein